MAIARIMRIWGTILLAITIFSLSFPAYAKYSGGSGEPNDPYQIATAEDLMLLGESPDDYNKHFIMIDNIDLDPNLPGRKVFDRAVIAPDTNDVESGFQGNPFNGIFDGNGHVISHLTIEGESYLGLFGQLKSGAELKNLGIVDVNIAGSGGLAGGLVGSNGDRNTQGGSVTDCHSTGLISGDYGVGGLIGINSGSISISYSTGTVTGINGVRDLVNIGSFTGILTIPDGVGGLVGVNFGDITACYSTGTVSGKIETGGLVGLNSGSLFACYSTSFTSGETYVGGLVGVNRDDSAGFTDTLSHEAEVTNCYSTGTVSGYSSIGGLVGSNGYLIHITVYPGPTPEIPTPEEPIRKIPIPGIPTRIFEKVIITNCYSTSQVFGSYSTGGLVGNNPEGHGITIASFWDIDTSGLIGSCGGVGMATAEMQTVSTFIEASWDFVEETDNGTEDIWWIDEGNDYPRLWWQYGQAFSAYTQDGATNVSQLVILSWLAGGSGLYHEVYFGEAEEAVTNATTESPAIYQGRQPGNVTSYDPGKLELDTTYYWRIDEADETDPNSPWKGEIWSFTTANFLVVDDFESYNDIPEEEPGSYRFYLAWIGGFDGPYHQGSLFDPDRQFIEKTIVHGGNQSMPFFYDNAFGKTEATLTLIYLRDWTIEGVKVLSIWFHGDPANDPEPMFVAITNSGSLAAVVYHDNPDAVLIDEWTEWRIDLTRFADQGVDLTNVNSITLGFGNRTNPVAGGAGMVYFDDIRLYRQALKEPVQ